ncbi:MAG: hypothetical protein KIS66_18045 [Fimbriimonadaceae bacterium]|nr:hypothetical protein [Fimbriimonadaceae bacterium]
MPVTNYHTVNGRTIGETTDGVRTDYLTDALGSVTATVDQSQNVLNTYRYKPYGGLLAKTGSSPDPRFLWTGDTGSRTTGLAYSEQYNRARHYGSMQAGWTSVDPMWPTRRAYVLGKCCAAACIRDSGGPRQFAGDLIVPILCVGACVGSLGCGAGFFVACRNWYPGYDSFLDCAMDYFYELPVHSRIGCIVATSGCFACLVKYAKPLLQRVFPGECTPTQWEAWERAIHIPCDLPTSCSSMNKGYPQPPHTRQQMCAFAVPRLAAGVSCLAARIGRQIACYATDKNPDGHIKAIVDTSKRAIGCLELATEWACLFK